MRMGKTIGLSLALLFVSTAAMAAKSEPGHSSHLPGGKTKAAKDEASAAKSPRKRHSASASARGRSGSRWQSTAQRTAPRLPPQDAYLGPVRVVGKREIGSAAWYGGYHVGMRTASGEPLDAVRATAAHRTLPLHSLVRVTNLNNGRSVIVAINDRGPVSHSLLIDVSPGAAEKLDMKSAGIARVTVEPVAPATPQPH